MSAVGNVARAPKIFASVKLRQPTIVFIGPVHHFSDCYVRTISSEIEGAVVARFDTLAAYFVRHESVRESVRLILLDAQLAPELLDRSNTALAGLAGSTLAVTYRDAAAIEPLVSTLVDRGVRGFLPLHVSLDVLLSILRLMASGGTYIPAELVAPPAQREVSGPGKTTREAVEDTLTPRQAEVLLLLAHGQQNKLIASALGLSQHTVKLHIHHIIRKLGVNNRTEAAAWYFALATP